jgi:hypothetical protein
MVDWLDRMMVKPRIARAVMIFLLPIPGDGDDEHFFEIHIFPERGRDLVAIHSGQADIEQDDVGPIRLGRLDDGLAVVRSDNVVSIEFKKNFEPPRSVGISDATPSRDRGQGSACGRVNMA